jgi:hypothetical protein
MTRAEYMRAIDPFWRRAMLASLAVLVAIAGACGAAACNSSSTEGADVNPDAAASMTPDATGDACEASSLNGSPVRPSVNASTWAQAEQFDCEVAADAGGISAYGFACWVSSCAGGINLLGCTSGDSTSQYYYDPSGVLFAEEGYTTGGVRIYAGPCTFNPDAVACTLHADAGCASGDGQAPDSGSPDSSADSQALESGSPESSAD